MAAHIFSMIGSPGTLHTTNTMKLRSALKIESCWIHVRFLRYLRRIPLLILPAFLSGCLTANTISFATHEHTRYLHDKIVRVESAVVLDDSNLVVCAHGKMAASRQQEDFTVSAAFPPPGGKESATVPRSAIVEGCNTSTSATNNRRPIATAPLVVLAGHQHAYANLEQFTAIEGAAESLYVVGNSARDSNLALVYVASGDRPRKIVFSLATKNVRLPHRYYLLFWLPLTIPADAATLPLQLLFYPMFASITC
jgi:hypothetical protein